MFQLHWAFAAARGFALVAGSGATLHCGAWSSHFSLLLWRTGPRVCRLRESQLPGFRVQAQQSCAELLCSTWVFFHPDGARPPTVAGDSYPLTTLKSAECSVTSLRPAFVSSGHSAGWEWFRLAQKMRWSESHQLLPRGSEEGSQLCSVLIDHQERGRPAICLPEVGAEAPSRQESLESLVQPSRELKLLTVEPSQEPPSRSDLPDGEKTKYQDREEAESFPWEAGAASLLSWK